MNRMLHPAYKARYNSTIPQPSSQPTQTNRQPINPPSTTDGAIAKLLNQQMFANERKAETETSELDLGQAIVYEQKTADHSELAKDMHSFDVKIQEDSVQTPNSTERLPIPEH